MVLLTDDSRFRAVMQRIGVGDYRGAIRALDEIKGLTAHEQTVVQFWRARCLVFLDQNQEATSVLQEAVSHVAVGSPLWVCLELMRAFVMHRDVGPVEAAARVESLLSQYAAILKTESDLLWMYAQAKINLGNFLVLSGKYKEGIEELTEALSRERDPLFRYYIHFWLGISFHQLRERDKAADHFEQALKEGELAPKAGISSYYAARLRYELSLLAYEGRRFSDAAKQLEHALEMGTTDPVLFDAMSRLKVYLNQVGSLD